MRMKTKTKLNVTGFLSTMKQQSLTDSIEYVLLK